MADHRNTDAKSQDKAAPAQRTNTSVARAALALLRDVNRHLDPKVMNELRAAALSAERAECTTVIKQAVASGTRREDLADFYIPELARQMGDEWCADELGFAGVTIGVSRLQSMLRDLGPDWSGDKGADPDAPSIMLIVLQDVYHTLGAMVLAGQLRRKGLSVRMMLGARAEEVVERLQQTRYDAVFISSSRGETLESLRRMVDVVKTAIDLPPPVVIGGTVLEVEAKENVTALTGADYATKFSDEALKLCGLETTFRSNVRLMRRT